MYLLVDRVSFPRHSQSIVFVVLSFLLPLLSFSSLPLLMSLYSVIQSNECCIVCRNTTNIYNKIFDWVLDVYLLMKFNKNCSQTTVITKGIDLLSYVIYLRKIFLCTLTILTYFVRSFTPPPPPQILYNKTRDRINDQNTLHRCTLHLTLNS